MSFKRIKSDLLKIQQDGSSADSTHETVKLLDARSYCTGFVAYKQSRSTQLTQL